jgi:hypothetical protein
MPRILQPSSLESKSLGFGKKDPMFVACSEKIFPSEIIGVMVQMMEVRFGIQNMVSRINYQKNPPNDPSSSEYFL